MFNRAAAAYFARLGLEVDEDEGFVEALKALGKKKSKNPQERAAVARTRLEREALLRFERVDVWATRHRITFKTFKHLSEDEWDAFESDPLVLVDSAPETLDACVQLALERRVLTPAKHREACAAFYLRSRLDAPFEDLARFFLSKGVEFKPDFFGRKIVRVLYEGGKYKGPNDDGECAALASVVEAREDVARWCQR